MRLEYCDWDKRPALKPRTMPSRYPAPALNMRASIVRERRGRDGGLGDDVGGAAVRRLELLFKDRSAGVV